MDCPGGIPGMSKYDPRIAQVGSLNCPGFGQGGFVRV